jgi:cholesterol oxidase
VLSAGTLGTTELLLRNRGAFPRLSRKLGTRFSGNGDLLTLALNTSRVTDGVRTPRIVDSGYGPVITTTARMPGAEDGGSGRGFYLQDAGYPQHLAWVLHVISAPQQLWRWRKAGMYLVQNWLKGTPDTDVTAEIADLMLPGALSSGGLPLLGMGRDIPDGRLYLRNGRLDTDWRRKASDPYFERLRTTSKAFAEALGGRFADNPLWFLRRVITVHPLGGAPMGRDPNEGVVDAWGNVFGHPGLHVADGSVMPGPTGPNPSFTIAALADRFADQIIEPDRRAAEAAAS